MRHNKNFNHLGRQAGHRKALLANMASSLILHKRINTTLAKAKALRMYVEPLITKSKDDSTHARRTVFSSLKNKYAVSELFREVAPKVGDRPGGYTRILKTGFRQGDGAEMCFIELVDFNTVYVSGDNKAKKGADAGKPKTRRGRGGAGKKEAAAASDKKGETAEAAAEEKAAVAETVAPAAEGEETKADGAPAAAVA